MKKRVIALTVILTVLFLNSVYAQNQLEFGFRGGLDLTTLTGDVSGVKSKLGFGIGGLARFRTNSPQFSIQSELLLIQKGAKEDESGGETMNLTYIEIPILFKYEPLVKGNYKPAFFAGPAFGVLLSAKIDDEGIKDDMRATELGITFGAGLDFKNTGKGYFSIDGRYTFGLTNIWDLEFDDSTVKNGMFYFGVSYLFSYHR
jgi:hypothetical protein